MARQPRSLLDPAILGRAARDSVLKLDPRRMARNPVLFVVEIGSVLVTAGLIAARKRWPAGLAAWAYSALMLAPTSAIVRQGVDLAPDRYTYLSGLGFALLAGGAVLSVIRLVRRGILSRSLGRVAIGCGH